MRRLLLAAAAVLAAGSSLPGEARAERPIVAVFDVQNEGSGLGARDLGKLVDYLAAQLAEGGYNVVPRDQLRRRLTQQKKTSFKACYDQSCQIELGRELSAQKALATKILRIGKTCHVTSELFDLKRAATERAATAEAACGINALVGAIKQVATKLCAEPGAPAAGTTARPTSGGDDHADDDHATDVHEAPAAATPVPVAPSPPATRAPPPTPPSPARASSTRPRSARPEGADLPPGARRVGEVIVTDFGARGSALVKLSPTRFRFETKVEKRTFVAQLTTVDGRTYTCPEVRLGGSCNLPRLAAGPASLTVTGKDLGPLSRGVEIGDDQELWIYDVKTWPKPGSLIAWAFGGIALATAAALIPVGFAIEKPGMYGAGFACLPVGAGLLWLGFILQSNVMVKRDDYDLRTASARPSSTLVVLPSSSGAALLGEF
jgi:hypothetical protein